MMQDTQAFLSAVYGDLESTDHWYIWTLAPNRAKASTWYSGPDSEAAARFCLEQRGLNVYWPVAFASNRGSVHERMVLDTVDGILGLVSDVDFKSDSHPQGPEDQDAALALIQRFPVPPTITLNSGNGLQCAWLFKEPWRFEDDEERKAAVNLARGFGYALTNIAAKQSYTLDAVHDLTRVMRVPGTFNVKRPERPLPVTLLDLQTDLRYNPQDLDEYCAEVPAHIPNSIAYPTVDVSADFPTEKHELLLEHLDEYRDTWEHNSRTLRGKSCSEYDMALAHYTVQANWTDDEIAALIREHRRIHCPEKPAKIADARYISKTIGKARSGQKCEETKLSAAETVLDLNRSREEYLDALSVYLNIPLQKIQRIPGDPTMFRFWIGGKCAEIEATSLTTQGVFISQMVSTANQPSRKVGTRELPSWLDCVACICRTAEEVEAGDGATMMGEFIDLVYGFVEGQNIVDIPVGELVNGRMAFSRGGRTWFKLDDLARYLNHAGYKQPRRRITQLLRAMGGDLGVHKREHPVNGAVAAKYWGVPARDE
jgi:hypothetical protein